MLAPTQRLGSTGAVRRDTLRPSSLPSKVPLQAARFFHEVHCLDLPTTSPRDGLGRFTPGNPGGPGRPQSPSAELRRALEDAISPDHAAAIIRRLTRLALEGDVPAARLVLERTCGRAADAPGETRAVGVKLPQLRTPADCGIAIERIADGIANGIVDLDVAKVLIDAIQVRIKTIETQELEQRLSELERSAASVEFGGSRRPA